METKLVRIAEISATSKHPIFTSVYHLINEDMLKQLVLCQDLVQVKMRKFSPF